MHERLMAAVSQHIQVDLFEFVSGISSVLDLISPIVVGHHQRTACIAMQVAEAAGLSAGDTADVVLASLLHDVGAFTLKTRLDTLDFDTDDVRHMEIGFHLLEGYPRFAALARIIRRHHVPVTAFDSLEDDAHVLMLSNVVQLADRVDVLSPHNGSLPMNIDDIFERIAGESGRMFLPDLCDVFLPRLRTSEFWQALDAPNRFSMLRGACAARSTALTRGELLDASRMVAQLVDFRSRFTATHSQGVAAVAEELGVMAGLRHDESLLLRVAGSLHDVGKLAIPAEILEKPGPLDDEEYRVMKGHAYYTDSVLSAIPGLREIGAWGARHHERLDGNGYPFHLDGGKLDLGARIMSVADVFTALTEDRPYRDGLDSVSTRRILEGMVSDGALDHEVVNMVMHDYARCERVRKDAQVLAQMEFVRFERACGLIGM